MYNIWVGCGMKTTKLELERYFNCKVEVPENLFREITKCIIIFIVL